MWLPSDDAIYLERGPEPHLRPARPISTGDVFSNVPLTLWPKYHEKPEPAKTKRVNAMLIGHVCSLYGGGQLATMQTVAEVRLLSEATGGKPFSSPWEGFWYLMPLPGFVNSQDYVVDFRRIGSIHFKYIESSRVACLNLDGWASLHRRYIHHAVRTSLTIEELRSSLTPYWHEFELWEIWNESGLEPGAYQGWLEEPLQQAGPYRGEKRRGLLEYAWDAVRDDIPSGSTD